MDGKLAYMHCVFRSLCTKLSAQLSFFCQEFRLFVCTHAQAVLRILVSLYRFGLHPTECIYEGVYFGTRIIPVEQNLNS